MYEGLELLVVMLNVDSRLRSLCLLSHLSKLCEFIQNISPGVASDDMLSDGQDRSSL